MIGFQSTSMGLMGVSLRQINGTFRPASLEFEQVDPADLARSESFDVIPWVADKRLDEGLALGTLVAWTDPMFLRAPSHDEVIDALGIARASARAALLPTHAFRLVDTSGLLTDASLLGAEGKPVGVGEAMLWLARRILVRPPQDRAVAVWVGNDVLFAGAYAVQQGQISQTSAVEIPVKPSYAARMSKRLARLNDLSDDEGTMLHRTIETRFLTMHRMAGQEAVWLESLALTPQAIHNTLLSALRGSNEIKQLSQSLTAMLADGGTVSMMGELIGQTPALPVESLRGVLLPDTPAGSLRSSAWGTRALAVGAACAEFAMEAC